jgi:DNA-directed RNA polymerase subunit RPC12/RpoP
MSEVIMKIEIPLDDGHYLRRECNLCKKEFKITISEDDLKKQTELLIQKYLEESVAEDEDGEEEKKYYYCPYCGQENEMKTYWTIPQLKFIYTHVKNYMNNIINKKFINGMREMSRTSRGILSFKGEDLPFIKPFITPEENDMDIVPLKCCNKVMKIISTNNYYYCFYCGFKHRKAI